MTKKYIFDYFYRIVIWHICRVKQIPFLTHIFQHRVDFFLIKKKKKKKKKKNMDPCAHPHVFYILAKYVSVSIQGLRYCF
jgi:hypothetical protein